MGGRARSQGRRRAILLEQGQEHGWPVVSYATNYNNVPIDSPDNHPEFKPKLYWTPSSPTNNITFYKAMFPQWNGSTLIGGMGTKTLNRIVIKGATATPAERFWDVGKRIRDVAVADGAIWLIEDDKAGGCSGHAEMTG